VNQRDRKDVLDAELLECTHFDSLDHSFLPITPSLSSTVEGLTLTGEGAILTLGTAPNPENDPWWKRITPTTYFALGAGAVALLFLLHELILAGKLGFPVDESWVHLVYARNFFHQISFEFNSGERVPGTAFGGALFHDPILAAKLLGSIFLFLTGYYSYRILRSLEFDHAASILGGFLVLTSSRLAWAELSGMESTIASALALAAVWSHLLQSHHGSDQRGSKRYVTGMLFAIGVLARPEIALLFVITLAHWIVMHLGERRRGNVSIAYEEFWRDLRATVLGFFVVLLPIILTNQALAGSFLPPALSAALGEHSLPMVMARGDFGELANRLVLSWLGVVRFLWIFACDHPLFIVTIPFAGALLIRRSVHTHLEEIFTLGIFVLIFFPYFHSLFLGLDVLPKSYALSTLFLTPIYLLTGITSLRILMERYVLRGPANRTILAASSVILLLCSIPTMLQFSMAQEHLIYWVVLFLLLLASATLLALTQDHSKEKGTRQFATDLDEFEKMKFSLVREEEDSEGAYSKQVGKVLRGTLAIAMTWNLTLLFPSAEDYADRVRANTNGPRSLANLASNITAPGSAIATDAIGAMGYYSERRIIDVEGRLPGTMLERRRKLGEWTGLIDALSQSKPQYLALAAPRYKPFEALADRDGYISLVKDSLNDRANIKLYIINHDRATVLMLDVKNLERLPQ
jgi:hypothetical protein